MDQTYARPAPPSTDEEIDWYEAARLTTKGLTTKEVARRLGCSPAQVSDRVKNDDTMKKWMAEIQDPDHGARLALLDTALTSKIENDVRDTNGRTVLWLSGHLQLVTPPTDDAPHEELNALLNSLSQEELREYDSLDAPTD